MIKLLDEKGLTTVWAAIKNAFTSKSDADGKYAKKADLADYAKKIQAMHSMDVYHTATDIQVALKGIDDFPLGFIAINAATSTSAGVMTAADKKKFDGIASGANNYTLPVASAIALGCIKVATNKDGTQWPICVNDNGVACTCINGLSQGYDNSIDSLLVKDDDDHSAKYGWGGIDIGSSDGVRTHVDFPQASGTFALTSDCGLLVMGGGIVNNNISFSGYKQNVLISASGNYNISNWYNSSPVGSVIDIYPYGEINGTITADNKYIFQMMGTSSSGLPQIVTKKSINLSSDHYIRLIHISDGVYVCVSVLGY